MKADVTVRYDGGVRRDLDAALRKTAHMVNAREGGSGAILTAPYTRDLTWTFNSKQKARAFARYVRGMMKLLHISAQVTAP